MAGGIGSGYHFLAGCSKHWFQSPQYRARKIVTTVEAQRAPQRLDGLLFAETRASSPRLSVVGQRVDGPGRRFIVRALTGLKQEASEIALNAMPESPLLVLANPLPWRDGAPPVPLSRSGSPPVARTSERAHPTRTTVNLLANAVLRFRRRLRPSPAPVLSSGRHGSPAVPPTPPPTPPPSPAGIEVDVSNPVAAVCWTEKGSVPTRLTVYPRADWGLRLADNKVSLGAHSFEMGTPCSASSRFVEQSHDRQGLVVDRQMGQRHSRPPRLYNTFYVTGAFPTLLTGRNIFRTLPDFGGVVGALYGPKERLQDTAFFAFFFFDVFESTVPRRRIRSRHVIPLLPLSFMDDVDFGSIDMGSTVRRSNESGTGYMPVRLVAHAHLKELNLFRSTFDDHTWAFVDEFLPKFRDYERTLENQSGVKGLKKNWVLNNVAPPFIKKFTPETDYRLDDVREAIKRYCYNNGIVKSGETVVEKASTKPPKATTALAEYVKQAGKQLAEDAKALTPPEHVGVQRQNLKYWGEAKTAGWAALDEKTRKEFEKRAEDSNKELAKGPPASHIRENQSKAVQQLASALTKKMGWGWGGLGDIALQLTGGFRNEDGKLKLFQLSMQPTENAPAFDVPEPKEFVAAFKRWGGKFYRVQIADEADLTVLVGKEGSPALPDWNDDMSTNDVRRLLVLYG
ncbi:hypothetical protein DFH06DRAFT_1324547 [Mycena polygramma]|nr:hypothetical protein DFH06DRAFT_1324547 [Mycena polygramma]